jgi:hypothetical protein
MHVAFVIGSLLASGAQRALIQIAGRLVKRGRTVMLTTMEDSSTDLFAVHAGVHRSALADHDRYATGQSRLGRSLHTFGGLRSVLRESQPDVVLLSSRSAAIGVANRYLHQHIGSVFGRAD